MDTQFKKGVLELVVLLVLSRQDQYGYQLVNEVNKIISVNEGTIYPLLKRLTKEKYCEAYLEPSDKGPARKYYKITVSGRAYLDVIAKQWLIFSENVNSYIRENLDTEK